MNVILQMLRRYPWLLALFHRHEWLGRLASRHFVESCAGYGEPRPRPFSLRMPYTSWSALTDRTYTGRQLGEDTESRILPDPAKVAKLFERKGKEIPATDTSVLFANFAQWFTDSFIRTQPETVKDGWRRNSSTHEIDLCQIYGQTDAATRMLRKMKDGHLKVQLIDGEIYPPRLFEPGTKSGGPQVADEFKGLYDKDRLDRALANVPKADLTKLFACGLEQGNATPGNIVLNTIFLRAHNHVADRIAKAHPDWEDDQLFETARNVMIALLLKIVLRDYIAHIAHLRFPFHLDPNVGERCSWKRSNWISVEFGLLYRWHALVPDSLKVGGTDIPIATTLWNPDLVTGTGIGPLLSAASRQAAGRIGLENTPAFFTQARTTVLDGDPATMSIQQKTIETARRAQLKPFNAYREAFGLKRVESFQDLTQNPALARKLSELYESIDDLDWYVGLFAEAHGEGLMLGDLLTRMVAFDAFTHIFGNPLLAKHVFNAATFSQEGMDLIERTTSFRQIVDWVVTDPASVKVSFDYTR